MMVGLKAIIKSQQSGGGVDGRCKKTLLNLDKTKQIITDFRKAHADHSPLQTNGFSMETDYLLHCIYFIALHWSVQLHYMYSLMYNSLVSPPCLLWGPVHIALFAWSTVWSITLRPWKTAFHSTIYFNMYWITKLFLTSPTLKFSLLFRNTHGNVPENVKCINSRERFISHYWLWGLQCWARL